MKQEDQERAAFERWFSNEGSNPRAVERNPKGVYRLASADSAWEVWQVRTALSLHPQGDNK